jgi:uncharacterized protein YjbI with pentapeptide repeats
MTPPGTPPPVTPYRAEARGATLRRAAVAVALVAAGVMAIIGFVREEAMLLASAWTFALIPLGYGIVGALRGNDSRAARLVGSGALVAVLAIPTFLVLRSCTARLGPDADLAGCDLSGLELRAIDLSGANLDDTTLADADLSSANLGDASLRGADLTGANLTGVNLIRADLSGADLRGASLERVKIFEARLERADLSGLSLDGIDLASANLRGANLSGASLVKATLEGADLGGANLTNTILADAELSGSNLEGVTIDGVTLDGALLIGATGLTDPDLAQGLGVAEPDLGQTLSEKQIRLEDREEIIAALGEACQGHGVEGAGEYVPTGFHPLFALGANGQASDFAERAMRPTWEPMALRFAHLVACIGEQEQETVEVCPYSIDGAPASPITRYQKHVQFSVVEAQSGFAVTEETLSGSFPAECPFTAPASQTVIEGSDVTAGAVERLLVPLVGP